MSKKIVFVCARFYPYSGGVEKHVLKLSEYLVSIGYSVEVISVTKDNFSPLLENYKGIEITRVLAGDDGLKNRIVVNAKFLLLIKKFLKSDVVHFHDYFPLIGWNFFSVLILKALRKDIFVTFHGWEGVYPPKKLIIFKRQLVEKICSGSISIGHFISKWYGTNSSIITYGATDQVTYTEAKCINKKIERFLFIGRLESDTGVLEYITQLDNYNNRVLQLDICGDGVLREEVENLARSSNHIINLHGFIDNLDSKIDQADAVFTSGYLGILECFARFKPVISVYSNDLKYDYLTMMPDYDKMINIIDSNISLEDVINKLEDSEYYQSITNQAYSFSRKHTWKKMANNYIKLWGRN